MAHIIITYCESTGIIEHKIKWRVLQIPCTQEYKCTKSMNKTAQHLSYSCNATESNMVHIAYTVYGCQLKREKIAKNKQQK